jgi:DNA primase
MTIDTRALKRDHPIEEMVERYGVELHTGGRTLLGRCPFHDDGGRPNLHVYPSTQSWYCYRCSIGGDVINFVERIEGVGFREAVMRLTGEGPHTPHVSRRLRGRTTPRACRRPAWEPDEWACLAAAAELYHNRLLTDEAALAYLRGRGLNRDIIDRCRLGCAAGYELVNHLRWRRIPIQAAMRIGLLRNDSSEFLGGRIVVPEIRGGQPMWLIGRTIDPDDSRPKYLGLPGPKPLLGWETAKDSAEVFLVEGVFDWLTLLNWGYPALALVGTNVRPTALKALMRFERVFLLLDSDEAGQAAAETLARTLRSRAKTVRLPGVKDVAELATLRDGRVVFAGLVAQEQRAA